jgi:uncharacterized repeat protein (TIGR03843 family)
MATSAETSAVAPQQLQGELEVVGRIAESSNLSVLGRLGGPHGIHVIYKPVRGERPLWDFPEGTLAGREVAAHLVSELGGWHLVPTTILRDGPLGPGAVQQWIGDPFAPLPSDQVVDLVPLGRAPSGWLRVLDGETPDGTAVTVVHAASADVRSLSVLDAVLNNSDRKGSHCLRDDAGRLWAIDHGVSFHAMPKLRTVLWGWAGQPFTQGDRARLKALAEGLGHPDVRRALEELLPVEDVDALDLRVRALLRQDHHPLPSPGWPSVPWPAL